MSERFSWTDPKICTYDFNLSKPWFVYFDYTDHLTGDVIRKQFRGPINRKKTKEDRILYANTTRDYWKKQLQAGYNPFSENDDLPLVKPLITHAFDLIDGRCTSPPRCWYRTRYCLLGPGTNHKQRWWKGRSVHCN